MRVELEGSINPTTIEVEVGGAKAELVGASSGALTVRIPSGARDGLSICGEKKARVDLKVGSLVASEFHAVANPVVASWSRISYLSKSRSDKRFIDAS